MGTDCKLLTEKKRLVMDRWYCFCSEIAPDRIYSKEEFIKLLDKQILEHVYDYMEEVVNEKDVLSEDDKRSLWYRLHWCMAARNNAGEKNVIFKDIGDSPYEEMKTLVEDSA